VWEIRPVVPHTTKVSVPIFSEMLQVSSSHFMTVPSAKWYHHCRQYSSNSVFKFPRVPRDLLPNPSLRKTSRLRTNGLSINNSAIWTAFSAAPLRIWSHLATGPNCSHRIYLDGFAPPIYMLSAGIHGHREIIFLPIFTTSSSSGAVAAKLPSLRYIKGRSNSKFKASECARKTGTHWSLQ
jgi:hypothetical protein